jgi:2-polyprenyl-3-methyl-5-hydroxy-6-metoxy-1,4-benzoquinol methylase
MITKDSYDTKYYLKIERSERNKKKFKAVLNILRESNAVRVLNLGCGNGYMDKDLSDLGYDVTSTDFSDYAGKLAPKFIKHDIREKLPFSDKEFDAVICLDVLEHLQESELYPVISEICRVSDLRIIEVGFRHEKVSNTHQTIHPKEWWTEKLKGCVLINR